MKTYYSPGCGVLEYMPDLAKRVEEFLKKEGKIEGSYLPCCLNKPEFEETTMIINTCPGCDKRFRNRYDNTETITLWEVLLDCDFDYPDYGGIEMSIHDSCDTKLQPQILNAVREIAKRMNIKVIEPEVYTRENARCCGESYTGGKLAPEEIIEKTKERCSDFPRKDVIVYCIGCAGFLQYGGVKTHHLLALIFNGATTVPTPEFDGYTNDPGMF